MVVNGGGFEVNSEFEGIQSVGVSRDVSSKFEHGKCICSMVGIENIVGWLVAV